MKTERRTTGGKTVENKSVNGIYLIAKHDLQFGQVFGESLPSITRNTLTLSAIFLCNINGNICSVSFFSGSRLFSQPKMKALCLRECAWKSQYIETPSSSVSLLIIVFVYQIDGYVSRITVRYCRLRSFPVNSDRVLPTMTPSGFSIGINLNMNLWRSFFAIVESPVRKSISPFIIHDDGVSPGWTRALITMARFFCVLHAKPHWMGVCGCCADG